MKASFAGFALLVGSSSVAAVPATDFGIRVPPGTGSATSSIIASTTAPAAALRGAPQRGLGSAIAAVSGLGRITSTTRTRARNKAVGGVANSFHLSGRAIDIVPRAGVRHADIEAALRRAGLSLIESIDEGDHSHFAFGTAAAASGGRGPAQPGEVTRWRMVSAPHLASR